MSSRWIHNALLHRIARVLENIDPVVFDPHRTPQYLRVTKKCSCAQGSPHDEIDSAPLSLKEIQNRLPKLELSQFSLIFNLLTLPNVPIVASFTTEYNTDFLPTDIDSDDILSDLSDDLTGISSYGALSIFNYVETQSDDNPWKMRKKNLARGAITKRRPPKKTSKSLKFSEPSYGDNLNQVIFVQQRFSQHSASSYGTMLEYSRREGSYQATSSSYKAHIDSVIHTQNWVKFRDHFQKPQRRHGEDRGIYAGVSKATTLYLSTREEIEDNGRVDDGSSNASVHSSDVQQTFEINDDCN
uniref:Uncharacterized protein n=1 Tax=Photinus pyralis TaxID=7054 RepID=A0A1Y1L8T6_PHOPY